MVNLNKYSGYIFLLIGVLCIYYNLVGDDLFSLNKVQFDTSGDGFKNYFSFGYQYKFGFGLHFKGMLYPFGEMAIYADAQVLIVWLIQFLKVVGLDFSNELIGLINTISILFVYIGAVCLYQIYTCYGVGRYYSLLFALICIALSPQLLRLQSHFALAYPLIPILWLVLIKSENKLSLAKMCLLAVALLLAGFIHPYHLFVLSAFMFLLASATWLHERRLKLRLYLCSILPILIFYSLVNSLDSYADRPSNPFGMEHHNTIWGDLLPYYGWFRECFADVVVYRSYYSEGYAYVGCLLLLLPLSMIAARLYRDKFKMALTYSPPLPYLITGMSALFLGAGLHNLFTGGLIMELLPPLKQFRGLGRLSWIYYYIIFVFLSVGFHRMLKSISSSYLRFLLFSLVVILWIYEAQHYHQTISANYQTYHTSNRFNDRHIILDMLSSKSLNHNHFQAAYTLPASTEGVEKIDIHDDWYTKMYAMEYAYQTGLPLTTCVMSRSSVSAVLAIQHLSNPHYPNKNPVFKNDPRPYLVIIQNERLSEYQDLLGKALIINKNKHISLYQIMPEDLLSYEYFDEAVIDHSIDLCSEDLKQRGIVFENFDDQPSINGIAGQGAYFIKDGRRAVIDRQPMNVDTTTAYFISVWYKIEADKTGIPVFYLTTYDVDGQEMNEINFRDLNAGKLIVHDDWVRLKIPFTISNEVAEVSLFVKGHHNTIDKILLCPKKLNTYLEIEGSKLMYANHTIMTKR